MTTWALFECVFYKFAAPCGWLSDRSCGHFGSQPGSYQRNRRGSAICKKRFQKCGVSPFILINISSLVLSDSYNETLFKPLHSVYVVWYWLIILVFVNRSLAKIYKHLLSENFLFYNQCCSPYTPTWIFQSCNCPHFRLLVYDKK